MAGSIKEEAHRLVENLDQASMWDDLMQAIYERLLVEKGIADIEAGRTVSNDEVRRRFGLPA